MRIAQSLRGATLLVALADVARAQGSAPPAALTISASVSAQHQFEADLDGGGTVKSDRLALSVGASRRFVPALTAGLSLGYEVQEWSFEGLVASTPGAPWGTVVRPSLGLSLGLALSPRFVTGVGPFLEWSYAREAGTEAALTGGAALSAFGIFSPRFTFGGGAKVQRQFFSTKVSPFVIVNWQLAPKLRLANASSAGPLGSGGVEIRYAPRADCEFAVGGVYRSSRFRLDARGASEGDVGEAGGIPILARASYLHRTGVRADLTAGAQLKGKLERRDPDGNKLAKVDVATAPTVSLTLSARR